MHDLSGNESGARTGRDWALRGVGLGDAPVTPRDGLARARARGRDPACDMRAIAACMPAVAQLAGNTYAAKGY